MQLVSCHNGVLRTLSVRSLQVARASSPCFPSEDETRAGSPCHTHWFRTGLPVLDALPPGGALVAVENIIDDDRRENVFGLMMSLNMLIEFGDAFDFTGADFESWCLEAGFKRCEVLPLAGPASAAIAGRTKSSKHTRLLTGLPGKPNTGVRRSPFS